MKMRTSSVFKSVLKDFEENRVKRIFRDFDGFLAGMFYTCFTLWPKCFTLLEKMDNFIIKEQFKRKGYNYVFDFNYSRLEKEG